MQLASVLDLDSTSPSWVRTTWSSRRNITTYTYHTGARNSLRRVRSTWRQGLRGFVQPARQIAWKAVGLSREAARNWRAWAETIAWLLFTERLTLPPLNPSRRRPPCDRLPRRSTVWSSCVRSLGRGKLAVSANSVCSCGVHVCRDREIDILQSNFHSWIEVFWDVWTHESPRAPTKRQYYSASEYAPAEGLVETHSTSCPIPEMAQKQWKKEWESVNSALIHGFK